MFRKYQSKICDNNSVNNWFGVFERQILIPINEYSGWREAVLEECFALFWK